MYFSTAFIIAALPFLGLAAPSPWAAPDPWALADPSAYALPVAEAMAYPIPMEQSNTGEFESKQANPRVDSKKKGGKASVAGQQWENDSHAATKSGLQDAGYGGQPTGQRDGSHTHGDQHATANVVPKGASDNSQTVGAHVPTRNTGALDAMGKPRIEKDPTRPTEVFDKSGTKPNTGKFAAGESGTRKMGGKWNEQNPGQSYSRRSAYADPYAYAYADAPAPVFRRSLEARDAEVQLLRAREAYMNALYARDMVHSY